MSRLEELTGAVARGWGHPENAHKEMDADLAEAIIDEVLPMFLRDRDPTFFDDVLQFHLLFNIAVGQEPELPDTAERRLRLRLIWEEFNELRLAHDELDIVEIADALADLIYVVCGMAVAYGIPLNRVWDEVHRSNIAKAGPHGQAQYRKDGKVLKPDGWVPPDVRGALYD